MSTLTVIRGVILAVFIAVGQQFHLVLSRPTRTCTPTHHVGATKTTKGKGLCCQLTSQREAHLHTCTHQHTQNKWLLILAMSQHMFKSNLNNHSICYYTHLNNKSATRQQQQLSRFTTSSNKMRRGGQQNKTQQASTHASRARERLTEKSFVACCSKKLQRACNNNKNMRNIQKKTGFSSAR